MGILQSRKESAMDLFPISLLRLHEPADHWLWRLPANQQQRQTVFRFLVTTGRADPDHSYLRHG
jgi:hypothetical protein